MGVFNRPDKQGNPIWYIRYRIGTKKKWERVGPNKHEAELLFVQRRKDQDVYSSPARPQSVLRIGNSLTAPRLKKKSLMWS